MVKGATGFVNKSRIASVVSVKDVGGALNVKSNTTGGTTGGALIVGAGVSCIAVLEPSPDMLS